MTPAVAIFLIACRIATGACETIEPGYQHYDGSPITLRECTGIGGQSMAARWLGEHPGYRVARIICAVGDTAEQLREKGA